MGHYTTTPTPGQYANFFDLPTEMMQMIMGYLPDVQSRALLRLVCRDNSLVAQSDLFTTWQLIPALQPVRKLWDLAFLYHGLINDAPVRDGNPIWIKKVVFEDVWPAPPPEFGISLEDTEEHLRCYLQYLNMISNERMSSIVGRMFVAAVGRLNALETLEYSPELHHTRPQISIPTTAQRRKFALSLEFHHDSSEGAAYAEDLWSEGRYSMYDGVIRDDTERKVFNKAIDEALRNPFREKPLKVIIKTRQEYALRRMNTNASPIPSSQLADVLDITYLKRVDDMVVTPHNMPHDLKILSDQQQVTGAHYTALTNLTIRGDGLGDDGALDMTQLGSRGCIPDWSALKNLRFVDVQFDTVAATYIRQLTCHLDLENVFWHGHSFEEYSSGFPLRSVKASGLFVVDNFDDFGNPDGVQIMNCVWVVASNETEADEIAASNIQDCTDIPLHRRTPFVLPEDVQSHMIAGGALPFKLESMWAIDWRL
jgi:hypothetical protein